jgi:dihydrofolate reductase
MIARCTAFIATSLDGYISRPDGRIDWLIEANQLIPSEEDCGFAEYMSSIDAIVMGRNSFEQVLKFDEWLYGTTHVYVLSRTLHELPSGSPDTTSLLNCSPIDLATLAFQQGHQTLYIDGGVTIQSFLSAGLLSEITITVIPVLLGEGRPLFGKLPGADLKLKLESSKSYPFGFVQNRYVVDGEGCTVRD